MSKLKYYDGTSWNIVNGQVIGDTLPIGAIVPYVSATAPTNWLVCDGSAVSRTTYAELFSAIGTSFGSGDGSTTFNLPNLKGRVAVGQDTSDTDFDTIGETGGSKYLQAHKHTFNFTNGTTGSTTAKIQYLQATGDNVVGSDTGGMLDAGTGNSGNLQPYQVVCYIIKTKQSAGLVANVSNVPSQSTTDTYSCDYINELINMLYPVGTIIIKADNNDYSNYLGFTWERTLVGRVAVGIDTTQTEFDTIGETGGSKDLQAHYHDIRFSANYGSGVGITTSGTGKTTLNITSWEWSNNTQNDKGSGSNLYTNIEGTGNSGNLQPYQVVAYWKRVS